jgi:hypothetical protein
MQMARNKSKSRKQAKIATRRLLEDEEVQKQLHTAAVRVQEAWKRASGRPASKALSDKKVYEKVREAATSLTVAGKRMGRKPEPPKHTGRKVVAATAVAGGAAYAIKKKRSSGTNGSEYNGHVATAPAAPPPFPAKHAPTAG